MALSPGSLRSTGVTCISVEMLTTFEADAGFVLWLYPQARYARLGYVHLCRDTPDLSEAVAACSN